MQHRARLRDAALQATWTFSTACIQCPWKGLVKRHYLNSLYGTNNMDLGSEISVIKKKVKLSDWCLGTILYISCEYLYLLFDFLPEQIQVWDKLQRQPDKNVFRVPRKL